MIDKMDVPKFDTRNLCTAQQSTFQIMGAALVRVVAYNEGVEIFLDKGNDMAYLKFPDSGDCFRIVKVKVEGELVKKDGGWTKDGASVNLMFR